MSGREIAVAPASKIAVTREEAAALLTMSLDSFERYVEPELRSIRLGRMVRVPVEELRRWASEAAETVLR